MAIGIRQAVRDLTGISDVNDLTDTDIDNAIKVGKGELYATTLKTDWDTDTSHPSFEKAQTLVHYVASYHILDRYAGNLAKATHHRDQAVRIAAELKVQYDQYLLVNSANNPAGSKLGVATSKYKTFPLNPDAEIPRSKIIIPGD